MGLIYEFRVILPFTVQEYQIAQRYATAAMSLEQTGGGEGIEVMVNEPFMDDVHPPVTPLRGNKQEFTTGQYTHKHYYLASKVPAFVRMVFPKEAFVLDENAWNAFPYCRTVITNPDYMKDAFFISIETMHMDDDGNNENAHDLPPEELAERTVVKIDIGNDPIRHGDYREEFDPSKYTSTKTNVGPLVGEWQKDQPVLMCAYKLVRCKFKWWGLQTRTENLIIKQEQRLFTNFHRMLFCMIDKWHGMTMEELLAYEAEVKEELDRRRREEALNQMQMDE